MFYDIFILILPIFLLTGSGKIAFYFKFLDVPATKSINRFLFYIGLPVLLIHKIGTAKVEIQSLFYAITTMYIVSISIFIIALISRKFLSFDSRTFYVGIHAAFRSNMAFVGLSILYFSAGNEAISVAAILICFTVPLYNVLGVICLILGSNRDETLQTKIYKDVFLGIAKNPLIWASIIGGLFNVLAIPFWSPIEKWLTIMGSLTLGMSLISLGVQMEVFMPFHRIRRMLVPVFVKLMIAPLLGAFLCLYVFDVGKVEMLVLIVLLGCPTAVVTFVMASEMKADTGFASDLVVFSTAICLVSLPTILLILRYLNIWMPINI